MRKNKKDLRVIRQSNRCPDCGSANISDNGEKKTSPDYTLACGDCGQQWEPNGSQYSD